MAHDDYVYLDPKSGKYYNSNEIDPSQFNIVDNEEESAPSSSWGDILSAIPPTIGQGLRRAAGGVLEYGSDLEKNISDKLGIDPFNPYGSVFHIKPSVDLGDVGADQASKAEESLSDVRSKLNLKPGTFKKDVFETAQAIPALASLALAPETTLPYLVTKTLGDRYRDLKKESGDQETPALLGATAEGLTSGLLNSLSLGRATNANTGLIRKALEIAGIGAASTYPQALESTFLDTRLSGNPVSNEDFEKGVSDSTRQALIQAPLFALAGQVGSRRASPKINGEANDISGSNLEDVFRQAAESQARETNQQEALPEREVQSQLPAPENISAEGEGFTARDLTPEEQVLSQSQTELQVPDGELITDADIPELPQPPQLEDPLANIQRDVQPPVIEPVESSARTPEEDTAMRQQLEEVKQGIPDISNKPSPLISLEDSTATPPQALIRPDASDPTPENGIFVSDNQPQKPPVRLIKSNLKSQRGALTFWPEKPTDMYTPEAQEEVERQLKIPQVKNTEQDLLDSEKFMSGYSALGKGKKARNAVAAYRNTVIFPRTLAKEIAPHEFGPFYEAGSQSDKNTYNIAYGVGKQLTDYASLPKESRNKIAKVLYAYRKAGIQGGVPKLNEEILAKTGLNPDEIKGALAVPKAMDSMWNNLEQAELMRLGTTETDPAQFAIKAKDIQNKFSELKAENFVPLTRFGEYYVRATLPDGKPYFATFESEKAQLKDKVRLNNTGVGVETGLLPKPLIDTNAAYPPELMGKLSLVDESIGNQIPKGFKTHLLNARGVEGHTEDLDRALSSYISGGARWAAGRVRDAQFQKAFENLQGLGLDSTNSNIYRYAQNYTNYIQSSPSELNSIRSFFHHYYLGLWNARAAAVNVLQPLQMGVPILGKYIGKIDAYKSLGRSYDEVTGYLRNPEKFANDNPERAAYLKDAIETGITSQDFYHQMSGAARGRNSALEKMLRGKSLSDTSMYLFQQAEQLNRLTMYNAGISAAEKLGMKGDGVKRFAEDLVLDTQGDYSRVNNPELFRGKKAIFGLFRKFSGTWLRLLRMNLDSKDYSTVLHLLGSTVAVAGAAGLPFSKQIIQGMEAAGYDPKKKARNIIGDSTLADMALNGLPMGLGVNLSGSLGFGDLAPDVEQGVLPGIGRTVVGVAGDIPQRLGKANYYLSLGNKERAGESLLPESLRYIARGARVANEGLRDAKGIPLFSGHTPLTEENVTTGEKLLYGLGGNPSRFSKAYEQKHSQDLLEANSRDNQNVNLFIAQARVAGDRQKEAQIKQSLAQSNMEKPPGSRATPNEQSIRAYMDQLRGKNQFKGAPKKTLADMYGVAESYR